MKIDPAFGDNFFDREVITSTLIKRVEAFRDGYHQNVAILGKPFIGKSTLLQNFVLTTNYPDVLPIYLEFQEESFSYFTRRLMGMMLVGFFQSVGKMVPHDVEGMIKAARRELPNTTKKMLNILSQLKRGKVNETFNELFLLTDQLRIETGKKILFVLDDFDRIEDFDLKDPFTVFGRHIMVQKDTLYIVSCSRFKKAYEIFNEKLSLLFGNFEILEMEPFQFRTCINFIESRLAPHGMPKNLAHFFIRLTDGHPYYLSVIIEALRRVGWQNAAEEMSEGMCIQVLEQELFYLDGKLSRHFTSYLNHLFPNKQAEMMITLVAIAMGHRKTKSIAQFTNKSLEEAKKNLAKLVSEEIVRKDGHFYCLDDSLLSFWLQYVYHARRVSLRVNKSLLNTEFRKKTLALMKMQAAEDKKEISKRVEELLAMFKNETVQVNNKRHKFPHFSNVVSRTFLGKQHPIIAKSHNFRWVCQVAGGRVLEDDVWAFLEELKKSRLKANQKILVIPYGIDMNAKLLAKEAKISLWRLKDLNYLLDLFNKPKLIIEEEEFEKVTSSE